MWRVQLGCSNEIDIESAVAAFGNPVYRLAAVNTFFKAVDFTFATLVWIADYYWLTRGAIHRSFHRLLFMMVASGVETQNQYDRRKREPSFLAGVHYGLLGIHIAPSSNATTVGRESSS